ncbi:U32 family peptidase C-terminal domain-containing protein, partial [Thiotrichales bacterium HSG1]|nr:U32 family peptidase C-terminal domain-containing protein [Thiotrichales bacterium HSG1]
QAIDNIVTNKDFDVGLLQQLDNLANRGYTEGFYRRHVPEEQQNYLSNNSTNGTQQFVGEVLGYTGELLNIEVKNHFECGDSLELILPEGNQRFKLEYMEDQYNNTIKVAPGSGHRVRIRPLTQVKTDYGLLAKFFVQDKMKSE